MTRQMIRGSWWLIFFLNKNYEQRIRSMIILGFIYFAVLVAWPENLLYIRNLILVTVLNVRKQSDLSDYELDS